jgi:hypothetical protein
MARRAMAKAQAFTDRADADGRMEAYGRALARRKRAPLPAPAPQPRG